MKKNMLVLLLTLLCVLCLSAGAQAEALTSGDYSYELLPCHRRHHT